MTNIKKYTILDFSYDILKESTNPLTFQEIWEKWKDPLYVNKLSLTGKTTWNTLGARMFVEVRDKPTDTIFNKVSESNSIKLYSFELKKNIDKSNYRAYFFQAVSNSSWANESYLVTAGLKQDDDLLSELERLCSSFGIGLIKLDLEDIDSSKVLFQARTKESTDWEMMNKLCEQNTDFESFIDDITKDYTVKTIHKSQYDKILEEPQEYIEQRIFRKQS